MNYNRVGFEPKTDNFTGIGASFMEKQKAKSQKFEEEIAEYKEEFNFIVIGITVALAILMVLLVIFFISDYKAVKVVFSQSMANQQMFTG